MKKRVPREIRTFRVVLSHEEPSLKTITVAMAKDHCRVAEIVYWRFERVIMNTNAAAQQEKMFVVKVWYKVRPHRYTYVAHFDPDHGVILDKNGPVYVIQSGQDNMYQPQSAEGVHLGMWMQGANEIESMPAGRFPFRAVYDAMESKARREYQQIVRQRKERKRTEGGA